jgi:hypothetical protein
VIKRFSNFPLLFLEIGKERQSQKNIKFSGKCGNKKGI